MKIAKNIINVVLTIIVVITVIFLFLLILGFKPYVVLSGSMEPKIETGSLSLIYTKAKYEDVDVNDVIAFKMNDKTLVTHRVVEITETGFVTKGDANSVRDEGFVTKDKFVGKNKLSIPKVGYLVRAFQTTNGKIIAFGAIGLLFVVGFLFGEKKEKPKEQDKEQVEKKE